MKKEVKERWLANLRSGEFKQCYRMARFEDAHCCLAVGAVAAGLPKTSLFDTVVASSELLRAGLDPTHLSDLIAMNDTDKLSFPQIADWIETNVIGD